VGDAREGRAHHAPAAAGEPRGEHHGVAGALLQREQRAQDERAGVGLPEGGEGVVGVAAAGEHRGAVEPPVEVGVLARVEGAVAVAVLVDGLEEQVALPAAGVVGVVPVAVARGVDEVAVAQVERHGDARAEVDQVDRVVVEAWSSPRIRRVRLARSRSSSKARVRGWKVPQPSMAVEALAERDSKVVGARGSR
jgi:hypothetical protein